MVSASHQAHAQQSVQTSSFNIPAQSLSSALSAFMRASDWDVSFTSEAVAGKRSAAAIGQMTAEQALRTLLSGTGVSIRMAGAKSVALIVAPAGSAQVGPGGATALEPIVLKAQGATTEGTSSYTTSQMSSATGLPLSIKETPQSVSVVTRQQIDDQNSTSLTDVLRNTTGVAESAYDTERSSFNYRGFSVDSYQYDGVPTTFSSPYAAGESALDSIIYDRIEVVRGATGLMNGAGNPSASVNLVRKRATSKELTGEVSASAGSWDNYRSTFDVSSALNDSGTVRGRLVGAGEYGESFLDHYSKKSGILYGTVEADLTEDTTLRVGADYQRNRPKGSTWGGALPTGWFKTGEEIDWPESYNGSPKWSSWSSDTQTQFFTLDHEFDNGWKGQVGYTHSKQTYDAKMGMSIGGLIDPTTWTTSSTKVYSNWYEGYREQNSIHAKLDGEFDLFGRTHEFMVGGSSTWQENYGTVRLPLSRADYMGSLLDWTGDYPEPVWGEKEPELDNRVRQVGLYSAARFSVTDDLKLIMGARYTNYDNEATDIFNVVSPYAGIVYDLTNNFSVYASYTDVFQPQEYLDRNGKYLDPIQGTSYETGIKGSFLDDRLTASLSFFYTKQDNVAEADNDNVVPGSLEQAYYGVDGTTSKGFEFEVGGEILPGWNVKTGYSLFSLKGPDGDELSTQIPRQTFNLFTTYRFQSGALEKLTVGGGVRWQSGIDYTVWGADESGAFVQRKAEQDGYAVVNLMARYDFTEQTALQLNVNNVFDEKYYSQINFYNTRNYGDPRNFTVKLTHKF
ncbi:TonB-dependent receptor [Neorhizobium sp. NCHU2750]|uniref:TonB-dependent siderophore receptor n=1 Tax=Neorhizobium sp. NCHU2750 TaxID=1825976 RepID=UPI001FDEFBF9